MDVERIDLGAGQVRVRAGRQIVGTAFKDRYLGGSELPLENGTALGAIRADRLFDLVGSELDKRLAIDAEADLIVSIDELGPADAPSVSVAAEMERLVNYVRNEVVPPLEVLL